MLNPMLCCAAAFGLDLFLCLQAVTLLSMHYVLYCVQCWPSFTAYAAMPQAIAQSVHVHLAAVASTSSSGLPNTTTPFTN